MVSNFQMIILSMSEKIPSVRNRLRDGEQVNDVTTFLYINAATRSRMNIMTWAFNDPRAVRNVLAEADFWSWGDPWKPRPLADRLAAIRRTLAQNLYTRVRLTLAANPDTDLSRFAFIPSGTAQLDSFGLARDAHQSILFYDTIFPPTVINEIFQR